MHAHHAARVCSQNLLCVLQMVMTTPGTTGEELWLEFQDPLLESRFLPVQQAALAQVCNFLAYSPLITSCHF